MKTITFIGITILSGAIAGTILALINLDIVEPFIEQAIALENERAVAGGEMITLLNLTAIESGSVVEK